MASGDLRDELSCSLCLDIYTDPVTLRCGHNFCQVCIDRVLDTQEESEVYTCPDCREKSLERPATQRNITPCNTAEQFLSTEPEQEETGIFCTYCIQSPVPAVKSCVHCEASLCDDHLRVHIKSAEHIIIGPTVSFLHTKCPVHKKILEFYCSQDDTCICILCHLSEHKGHQVDTLSNAFNKKKMTFRNVLEKLTSNREDSDKRVQSLEERRRRDQEKAAGVTEKVTALIRDIRRQLAALEERVLSEISRQEERVSLQVSDLIRQLEIKNDELSRKMSHIEELCNMMDPFTLFKLLKSDRNHQCDTERAGSKNWERDVKDLDESPIFETLHTGLADIVTGVKRGIYVPEASDLMLDINTAADNLAISDDLKESSCTGEIYCRLEKPERFVYSQVLSSRSFSSGRHYWEVEASDSVDCRVGVAYYSIERKNSPNWIGDNYKSWCLCMKNNEYSMAHDSEVKELLHALSCHRIRIYLDYEAGQLSFYELSDPIRHLHTFTATFTEPLHAAFCLFLKSWVKLTS